MKKLPPILGLKKPRAQGLGLKNSWAQGLGLKTRKLGAEESEFNPLSPMFSARLLQPVFFSPSSSARLLQPVVFSPSSSAPGFSPNTKPEPPSDPTEGRFGSWAFHYQFLKTDAGTAVLEKSARVAR